MEKPDPTGLNEVLAFHSIFSSPPCSSFPTSSSLSAFLSLSLFFALFLSFVLSSQLALSHFMVFSLQLVWPEGNITVHLSLFPAHYPAFSAHSRTRSRSVNKLCVYLNWQGWWDIPWRHRTMPLKESHSKNLLFPAGGSRLMPERTLHHEGLGFIEPVATIASYQGWPDNRSFN